MFCCTLLYVHSSTAIILMGKRELVALLNLSFWCFVMVERLFLALPWGCLRFVIVVFPDHTHLLFLGLYRETSLCLPVYYLQFQGSASFGDLSCLFLSFLFFAAPVVICRQRAEYLVHLYVMFSCSVTLPYEVLGFF